MNLIGTLFTFLIGSAGGAVIVYLLRNWITVRLKESIKQEYSIELKEVSHKMDLRLQKISHEKELNQLRTSLFFDHQREAFAKILTAISDVRIKWHDIYDPEDQLDPVPSAEYNAARNIFYKNQLFLDGDCIVAVELALKCMSDSFPIQNGSTVENRDCDLALRNLEFVWCRLPGIFQEKIGIYESNKARKELALFGAIKLLNSYGFTKIDLIAGGVLKLGYQDDAANALNKAEKNKELLVKKLKEFQDYLEKNPRFFYHVHLELERYLKMLTT